MASILSRDGTDIKGAGNVSELSAEDKKIVDLADPTNDQDAATKAYVDAAAGEAGNALDGTFTIDNTADPTKKIAFDAANIATATERTITMPDADVNLGLVNTAVQSSEKGAANGVATLNALGKLSAGQVPAIAISETFVVADIAARDALVIGTGDGEVQKGDVAVVTDASADPAVDDGGASYIYTGSAWQRLISPTDSVASVNGQTGTVVLDTDDIAEGSANLYYTSARFDSAFAAKDTDDLSEGTTNLYFTEARAKSAAVADAITDGVTDVAPSQNAVFDALALKADQADLEVVEADSGKLFDAGLAGEAFAANQVWLVRRAKSGETAGSYYKAQADSFANSRAVGFIVVGASGISAADPIKVYKLGEGSLGSSDTGFGAGNINAPVYLHQSTPGKFTLTPVTTTGSIIKPIGFVANDLMIEFQPELAIQA